MMKQKAQSLYVAPYGASYASIFDETDKEHRRYKLTTTFIDDGIQVTSAREVTPFTDVVQAFNDYVDAKNNALNSISSIDSVELDPEGNVENLARSAFGISTYTLDDCKANEVSSDTKTAHDYVSSSSNRRVLFYKLMNMLDSHTGGTIAEAALKYGAVLNKLEGDSNSIVSFAGSALGVLNVTEIKILTQDGGFMKGYMNFTTESFDIVAATDGDCNYIPTNVNDAESEYNSSTGSGADNMIDLLLGFGGKLDIPVCQKEVTVCTGVHGETLVCTSICFRWK